jgi:hypothetical protein
LKEAVVKMETKYKKLVEIEDVGLVEFKLCCPSCKNSSFFDMFDDVICKIVSFPTRNMVVLINTRTETSGGEPEKGWSSSKISVREFRAGAKELPVVRDLRGLVAGLLGLAYRGKRTCSDMLRHN